ncbi:MAG: hypothetical protein QOG77_2861, partial [Solirubrobacteraceae bacterium]|nr:hypothetical protein [Solirubrobacteraceae bacterium]
MRARNRWGWGFEDAAITPEQARAAAPALVRLPHQMVMFVGQAWLPDGA